MRRRRLIRSAYRSGTKKKSIKPILIRVAFVLVLVAVTTSVALLLGSYLDERANFAESLLETHEKSESSNEKTEMFPGGVLSDSDVTEKNVCAAHIEVVGVSEESVAESIRMLGDMYSAVSINVVSPTGSLVYLSDSLMNYVRLDGDLVVRPSAGEVEGSEVEGDALPAIKTALAVADELGMRKSAVFSASSNVLENSPVSHNERITDGIILGEMYDMGFDEVITTELLKKIVSYLSSLRDYSGEIDIGVVLPSSVYLVPQSASFIKTLSEYADFLAISVNTDAEDPAAAYSSVYDNCHSLKGNFSVYNIRGMIETDDVEVAQAVYAALCDLSVKSVQFSTYVSDPAYVVEIPDDTPDESVDTGKVNDNAVSKEDYLSNDENT